MDRMLEENRDFIDRHLEQYLKNDQRLLETLFDSVNYTLFSGGKRIRPLFCFLAGELLDVPRERLVSLGCALEMIHTASLIMDDLPHMDGAESRRGKPANHLVYGQDVAALASIGLLLRAYEVVLEDRQLDAPLKTELVHQLARSVGIGGMVGGQFADLYYADSESKETALDFIHRKKTAALFVAAGVTAAMVGQAAPAQVTALETFSANFGICFQILDDLSDRGEDGDDPHSAANFVTLYGVERAKRTAGDCLDRALQAITIFGEKSDKMVALCRLLKELSDRKR